MVNNLVSHHHHHHHHQEVWFVNIYESINPQHRNLFAKFDFKLLASLFNSFNEFMLIDADTILMKSPEFFFNHQSYQQTGAFFSKIGHHYLNVQ